MSTTEKSAILVGVDGSVAATLAVKWAASEAARRNAPLHFAHAVDYAGIASGFNLAFSQSFFDAMEDDSKAFLAEAEREARSVAPDVRVSVEQLAGPPVTALVESSKHALLTVVGARGSGGFAELIAGSI